MLVKSAGKIGINRTTQAESSNLLPRSLIEQSGNGAFAFRAILRAVSSTKIYTTVLEQSKPLCSTSQRSTQSVIDTLPCPAKILVLAVGLSKNSALAQLMD